jgi:hypothetical protein
LRRIFQRGGEHDQKDRHRIFASATIST